MTFRADFIENNDLIEEPTPQPLLDVVAKWGEDYAVLTSRSRDGRMKLHSYYHEPTGAFVSVAQSVDMKEVNFLVIRSALERAIKAKQTKGVE